MSRNVLLVGVICASGILVAADPAPAAGRKKIAAKPDPAPGAVEKVLRAELAGDVDRRTQLAETLKQHPDSAVARWQAGFVKDGASWRSFDAPTAVTSESELLKDYRVRRDDAPRTFPGQLDLANWCRKNGLKDQERAHLHAALTLDPEHDHADILIRLGFRAIGGVWLSPEDFQEWRRINQQTEASLKRWEAKLTAIAGGLSGSPRQRDIAVKQLREITDPAAIPAVELVLSGVSEETALAAIDALRHIDGPQASVALAKQGVFSSWQEVRNAAAQALKTRTLEHFVPGLNSLLATPLRTQWTWSARWGSTGYGAGSGVLLVSYVLARETDRQFQVATYQSTNYLVNSYVDGMIVKGQKYRESRGQNLADSGLARGAFDVASLTDLQIELQEQSVAEFNERTAELNRRIGNILSVVSGREPSTDPAAWWNWWNATADLQQGGNKPVVSVSESEVIGNPTSGFRIMSCFAAGTPVWTESGAQAIETIKVGVRVLAKDIETGELGYKPVLQTTVRPPKELTTLRFGDETIVCTGGHRFWSSGSGWIKARDLAPQTLLHTVTGNTPVWSAKKGNTAETYNLVVADFHTYFVGKTGVLCQDLLIPRSTNNVVPGLPRAQAAAQK